MTTERLKNDVLDNIDDVIYDLVSIYNSVNDTNVDYEDLDIERISEQIMDLIWSEIEFIDD